ncbi:MAG: acetate--CoA ligase family protein [Thermoleophilaceae bacterium]|nr:acetate--CoA ligase family protein [Thermoleophilaceae bacterium]
MQRLLHPKTIAVVGANDREGSYSGETLLNLRRLGYPGTVWGVNPGRAEAHGFPCFPSLSELPEAPDAVVVAIPAAGVAAVVEEAGALGCGGAVVYGAGFGEIAKGAGLERELAAAARRHGLPVCGPNGNGIVQLHERVALWGDALRPLEPGRVALVSQSGNVAVNTLATLRGLRLHTVVSCGNSAALDPAEWIAQLAREDDVGSIAVYLEADGDGVRLCEALAECADRGVGVTVLKVGASPAGALAAAAHTGAVAGDQRVFRALVEEAGAAWAEDVHELLELAKAQAVTGAHPQPRPETGLAVLTCSGGDSALAADYCDRNGLPLPALAPQTAARLRELLPDAATVGNPLDYTALIWGEVDTLRDIVLTVAGDPSIDQIVVLYDQPVGVEGASAESWARVREGIHQGAAGSRVPVMVASTLPELLDDDAGARFADAGIPAIAGLRTGLVAAAMLRRPPGDGGRMRAIAAAAARGANGSVPLAEHEAKALLRSAGLPVVEGRLAAGEDEAAAAIEDLGPALVLKLSAPALMHKSELRALALDLRSADDVRAAYRRLVALGVESAAVLVERMEAAGAELLVAARRDAVVPALVVGLGGVWTEIHGDAAVVPLPATPERVEAALRSLRGAGILTGARGGAPLDLAAAARLGAQVGDLLLSEGLGLIELNPVLVHEHGALAVDALAA